MAMPADTPKAVNRAVWREWVRLLRAMMAKSGPGLSRAKNITPATAAKEAPYSNKKESMNVFSGYIVLIWASILTPALRSRGAELMIEKQWSIGMIKELPCT